MCGFFGIRSVPDDLCRSVTMNRVMKLVLDGREETAGNVRMNVIVGSRCEQIRHLLVGLPFTCTDLSDFFKKLVEVRLIEKFAVLQTFRVQQVASDHEVTKHFRRPLAESSSTLAVDAVADGNDGVEVVVLDLAIDRARAFLANN